MEASERRCAITGASGYLGSLVSNFFTAHGWTVFAFTRMPCAYSSANQVFVRYSLDSSLDPHVFRDLDIRVLVHCAYDFRPVKWREIHRINVIGSTRLLRSAKEAGVGQILFLSSISAFDGCSSLYGKAKLEIEGVAAEVGAHIIRPGLVYGGQTPGGMFDSLQRSIARSNIMPLIGSGKYVQYLVDGEDLCRLLFRIGAGETGPPSTPVVAASPRGWELRDLLQVMAAAQHKKVRFVQVPWRAIWLGLKCFEMFGVSMPFRSDSVISLVRQNPQPDFSVAARMACQFRDFDASGAIPD